MSTLDRFAAAVHHLAVAVPSAAPVTEGWTGESVRPVLVVAMLLAIVLLGGALKSLGRAFAPIGELVRMVVSAFTVAVLLLAAIGLLIAVLLMSAGR